MCLGDGSAEVCRVGGWVLLDFAPGTAFRIATKEIDHRGQKIKPGDYVAVVTLVVGRDPTFYSDPEEVRFDRKAPHMSLGSGIHKCLGMHLARLELQIAVEEFVTTLPEFRIKDGDRKSTRLNSRH